MGNLSAEDKRHIYSIIFDAHKELLNMEYQYFWDRIGFKESLEVNTEIINGDPRLIKYMSIVPLELQKMAVDRYSSAIEFIDNPTPEVMLRAVRHRGSNIQYIKEPPMPIRVAAIVQDPMAIRFIKNPSEELCIRAIENQVNAFKHIKDPSEKVILTALRIKGKLLKEVESPTENMINTAIDTTPSAIQYVKNPTEKQILKAISGSGFSLKYIQNPTKKHIERALDREPKAIRYVKNPTDKQIKEAIQRLPSAISNIEDPPKWACDYVIEVNPTNIKLIKDQSEDMCLRALEVGYAPVRGKKPVGICDVTRGINIVSDKIVDKILEIKPLGICSLKAARFEDWVKALALNNSRVRFNFSRRKVASEVSQKLWLYYYCKYDSSIDGVEPEESDVYSLLEEGLIQYEDLSSKFITPMISRDFGLEVMLLEDILI